MFRRRYRLDCQPIQSMSDFSDDDAPQEERRRGANQCTGWSPFLVLLKHLSSLPSSTIDIDFRAIGRRIGSFDENCLEEEFQHEEIEHQESPFYSVGGPAHGRFYNYGRC